MRYMPLALALLLATAALPPCYAQAAPQPITIAAWNEETTQAFAALEVGMSESVVLLIMKKPPNATEISTHLGVEVKTLTWSHWGFNASVTLFAGRLASKRLENKALF